MTPKQTRIPPGPSEPYRSSEDLFAWMNDNFARYGDIYRASIYGSEVYVVSNPEYCERILRWNWQNYPRKGQVVKRISLLLGNGLIASNGDFWASQRRMVQTAFTRQSIEGVEGVMVRVNQALLARWTAAASAHETVNVTRDISLMVLETTLFTAIFGDLTTWRLLHISKSWLKVRTETSSLPRLCASQRRLSSRSSPPGARPASRPRIFLVG